MSKTEPEISCILCHHTGSLVYKAVESIKNSSGVIFEIIIMTSDTDLAIEGIPDCSVNYTEAMPAEKRNIGVSLAKAPLIAFFDDDVEIDPTCLHHFKLALEQDKEIGMVYGKLWNMERRYRFDEAGGFMTNTGFIWSRAGQNDIDSGQYDEMCYVLAGKSASCMVKKDVFNKAGGFDESFEILGEETDLSWRIWLSGYTNVFIPQATGYHAFNTKFKPPQQYYTSKRVQFNGCRNYITMLLKNLGRRHLWIVPIHAGIWFSAGLVMIITGKANQGLNILGGLWYVVKNLKDIYRKRVRIQSKRKIDESNLWSYIHSKTPRGYYLQRFCRYLRIGLHG